MNHVQIARRDRWKPWTYRGRAQFYLIFDWGGDTPVVHLFDRRQDRQWYLEHAGQKARLFLGMGKITYWPQFQPGPG